MVADLIKTLHYSLLILTIMLQISFFFLGNSSVITTTATRKYVLGSVDIQNVDLTLNRPIYTERFEVSDQGINNDTIFDKILIHL